MTTPQSPSDIAAIAALAGAELPAAYRDYLVRVGVTKAMTAWWSADSGQYLPPDMLVIGVGGVFCPMLLGSGSREGIWYLTETVARPWQPEDEQLLHLIRPDFASFAQALG